jgi:hypothetical protein
MKKILLTLFLAGMFQYLHGQTKFNSNEIMVFEYNDEFKDRATTVDHQNIRTSIVIDLNAKTISYQQGHESTSKVKIISMSFNKNGNLTLTCEGSAQYIIRDKAIELHLATRPNRYLLYPIDSQSNL